MNKTEQQHYVKATTEEGWNNTTAIRLQRSVRGTRQNKDKKRNGFNLSLVWRKLRGRFAPQNIPSGKVLYLQCICTVFCFVFQWNLIMEKYYIFSVFACILFCISTLLEWSWYACISSVHICLVFVLYVHCKTDWSVIILYSYFISTVFQKQSMSLGRVWYSFVLHP